MKKNDLLVDICDSIGYNGEGILHHSGTTIFMHYCLVGERVEVKILKVKGNVAYGKLMSVIEKSPERTTPKCPVFGKCGGCQLQHSTIQNQRKIKEETVRTCFKKIAGLDVTVDKTVGGEKIYGYRNKLSLPTRHDKNGNKIGFFREGSHDVVETDACPIHPEWADKIIAAVKDFVLNEGISLYDEETKKGLLRHVVVREINGEFIITLVINGDKINGVNRLIDRLLTEFGKISVYININKSHSNVILSDKFVLIYGDGKIQLEEFGIKYAIGAQSFIQVNDEVKKLMYEHALSSARLDESTVAVDGYSGAGVLTAMLAKRCKKAYGVEIIEEAVLSARDLAIKNGLEDKMESVCAPCEDALPGIIERAKKEGNKTVLILDPPRKGVSASVLQSALKNLPDRIIYIACSPQSLARDVGVLVGGLKMENDGIIDLSADFSPNYVIESITLFDLFPQTKHVESVVCLTRPSRQ